MGAGNSRSDSTAMLDRWSSFFYAAYGSNELLV